MTKLGNGLSVASEPLRYKIALAVSMFAACILGGWIGVYAGDRDPPSTTYEASPVERVVKVGGELRVRYVVRRHRSCQTHVNRFIYDGENQRHILESFDIAPGLRLGEDRFTVPVRVPENAVPGPARYSVVANYVCNPIHMLFPIVAEQRDILFDIAPR